MNAKLIKRLPSFSLRFKNAEKFIIVDATGLTLCLKRISIDNINGSIDIPLENTSVDLNQGVITINSSYTEPFDIYLTNYEVDQVTTLMLNYINLSEEKTTLNDLH